VEILQNTRRNIKGVVYAMGPWHTNLQTSRYIIMYQLKNVSLFYWLMGFTHWLMSVDLVSRVIFFNGGGGDYGNSGEGRTLLQLLPIGHVFSYHKSFWVSSLTI
jgi:hypothetical protein